MYKLHIVMLVLAILPFQMVMAQQLADPTKPWLLGHKVDFDEAIEDRDYKLNSVLFASDRRIAIVNGVRVKEGDVMGTAVVQNIEKRKVILVQDEEIIELELAKRPLVVVHKHK